MNLEFIALIMFTSFSYKPQNEAMLHFEGKGPACQNSIDKYDTECWRAEASTIKSLKLHRTLKEFYNENLQWFLRKKSFKSFLFCLLFHIKMSV